MRRPLLKTTVERLETREDASNAQDRIASVARAAAVRGAAARLERNPLKTFMRDGDIEAGGFGDDGGIGAPLRNERVRTNAGVLFVHHRRNDDAALRKTTGLGQLTNSAYHRGDTAFHVLRAATVEPA